MGTPIGFLRDSQEKLLGQFDQVLDVGQKAHGTLFLTNYRLLFLSAAALQQLCSSAPPSGLPSDAADLDVVGCSPLPLRPSASRSAVVDDSRKDSKRGRPRGASVSDSVAVTINEEASFGADKEDDLIQRPPPDRHYRQRGQPGQELRAWLEQQRQRLFDVENVLAVPLLRILAVARAKPTKSNSLRVLVRCGLPLTFSFRRHADLDDAQRTLLLHVVPLDSKPSWSRLTFFHNRIFAFEYRTPAHWSRALERPPAEPKSGSRSPRHHRTTAQQQQQQQQQTTTTTQWRSKRRSVTVSPTADDGASIEAVARLFVEQDTNKKELTGWSAFAWTREIERLQVEGWRVSRVNGGYAAVPGYPGAWLLPASVDDSEVRTFAGRHVDSELPLVVWSKPGVLLAVSKPRLAAAPPLSHDPLLAVFAGLARSLCLHIFRSGPKELLRTASSSLVPLSGSDASSLAVFPVYLTPAAVVDSQHDSLAAASLLLGCSPSLSSSRDGEQQSVERLVGEWHVSVKRLLSAAVQIAQSLQVGNSVVFESGADGEAQHAGVVCVAMLLSDSYYRTTRGFQMLLASRWLNAGTRFLPAPLQRQVAGQQPFHGHGVAPAFVLFLDACSQLLYHYPGHFEFEAELLLTVVAAVYSGKFGTFLAATERERSENDLVNSTCSVFEQLAVLHDHFAAPDIARLHAESSSSSSSGKRRKRRGAKAQSAETPSRRKRHSQQRASQSLGSFANLAEIDGLQCAWWSGYFLRENGRDLASLRAARHLLIAAYAREAAKLELSKACLSSVPSVLVSQHDSQRPLVGGSVSVMSQHMYPSPASSPWPSSSSSSSSSPPPPPLSSLAGVDLTVALRFELWDNLVDVDLSHNQFQRLPDFLCRLPGLQRLTLAHNLLTCLPSGQLCRLPAALQRLDVSHNRIRELPEGLTQLSSLVELVAAHNQLVSVAPLLGRALRKLRRLDVSSNRLKSLPIELDGLHKLRWLAISNNAKMRVPPPCLFRLAGLVELHATHMNWDTLADDWTKLDNLSHLNLDHNNLRDVPLLPRLVHLSMGYNRLATIPLEIANLNDLCHLDVRHNIHLASVSSGLGSLPSLRHVDLSGCAQLEQLPASLGWLEQLQHLSLAGCRALRVPPPDVVAAGLPPVKAFLRELLVGSAPCHRAKLMVVGQENVGKTSLVQTLLKRKKSGEAASSLSSSSSSSSSPLSTDGIDVHAWSFAAETAGQSIVSLSVWDFAGQDVYYISHELFLSSRALYLVVFNLVQGFDESSRIDFWLQSIAVRVGPSAPVVLVGTHVDSYVALHKEFEAKKLRAQLAKLYCRRFANILAVHFVSCSTGKGFDGLRSDLEKIVVAQPWMGQVLPTSYLELEKLIEHRRDRVPPVLTWSDFAALAATVNIHEPADLRAAAQLLHALGAVCYFGADARLGDAVITEPRWLINLLASILSTKHTFVRAGLLNHRDLPHIWKPPDYPPSLHATLLRLLMRFSILLCVPRHIYDAAQLSLSSSTLQALPKLSSPSSSSSSSQLPALTNDAVFDPADDASLLGCHSVLPSLLPLRRPTQRIQEYLPSLVDNDVLMRQYRMDFLPYGLFSQLMVSTFYLMQPLVFWRNGFVAKSAHTKEVVFVEQLTDKRAVQIVSKGAERGGFRVVVEALDNLCAETYKLRPNVAVPCPHCMREGAAQPFLFPLEVCEALTAQRKVFALCSGVRPIRLDQLIPDITLSQVPAALAIDFLDLKKGEQVGTGGYSTVYEGWYNGSRVAIKHIKLSSGTSSDASPPQTGQQHEVETKSAADDMESFRQFRREVWIMSSIQHPNLVRMLGFCVNPWCLITEFVPLGNLFDYVHDVARNPLPWPLRFRIARDIAAGIAFLHSVSPPIIHRDLKSPNVFLVSHSPGAPIVAKVGDFGLSQVMLPSARGRDVSCPVWLAPEIIRQEPYSEKADVYSFGVVLWELTERRQFFGELEFLYELQEKISQGERPPIQSACLPSWRRLIEQCWHQSAQARPSFRDIVGVVQFIADKHRSVELARPHLSVNNSSTGGETTKLLNNNNNNNNNNNDCSIDNVSTSVDNVAALQRSSATASDGAGVGQDSSCHTTDNERRRSYAPAVVRAPIDWRNSSSTSLTSSKQHEAASFVRLLQGERGLTQLCKFSNFVFAGMKSGAIVTWSLITDAVVSITRAHAGRLLALEQLHNGLWSCGVDGSLRVWQVDQFGVLSPLQHVAGQHLACLAETDTGYIWGGRTDGQLVVLHPSTLRVRKRMKQGLVSITALLAVGDTVWVGSNHLLVRMDAANCTVRSYLQGHTKAIHALVQVGATIWSASADKTIRVWSTDGEPLRVLRGHTGRIFCLAKDADAFVWSAGWDTRILVWDARTYDVCREYADTHTDTITAFVELPGIDKKERKIWCGSTDGFISVWRTVQQA